MLTTGVVLPDPAFSLTLFVLLTLVIYTVERTLRHGGHGHGRR